MDQQYNTSNPTPSAAAEIREIYNRFYAGKQGVLANPDVYQLALPLPLLNRLFEEHAAQREAITRAVDIIEWYEDKFGPTMAGQAAIKTLRAVHSGGSTGQAKEGGAS